MNSKRQLTKHKVDHLGFNTDAEKIIGYLDGSFPKSALKAKLVEKVDRIVQAKAWLFEFKFQSKVVEMMINHYQYSEVTAYRDLRLMERVFGPLLRMSKDLKRALADEMIRQDRELAITNKDTKALGASTRNYILLHQLDKEDPELPDLSNFDFHPIIMAVLPEQVGQDPPSEDELLDKVSDWWESQSEEAQIEDDE
jgi:hypothetical protein